MNLSTATLVALLQRSPAVRFAAAAEELVIASPVGTLLKAAAAAAASLGAIDSMAGATILASSVTPNPSGNLPTFDATVGTAITPLGFTITNTMNVASWTITGNIPPGLKLVAQQNSSVFLTAAGNLDATSPGSTDPWTGMASGGNPTTTPILQGTPTTAGSYTFNLQGFALPGEQGGGSTSGFVGTGISAVFPFTVVVTAATSTVSAPVFTTQPISVTVTGGTVAFYALASNSPTYQWTWNGSNISGATDPVLLISNSPASVGTYTCVATNSAGNATSNPATLAITSTNDLGRLINISCRAQVGTGSNVLIAGYVVGGGGTSGKESLLIRGSGPALAAFGVTGTLPDPELQLYQSNPDGSSTLLQTNNGWAGSTTVSTTAAAVGAFPWTNTSSHDSALVASLDGPYTTQISGQSGDTGVALAEIYDATPAGTYTPSTPRLINISARVQVGTGGNVLIAGFVIGGSSARTLLIRGSGPALAAFGVTGTLADPELQLNMSHADGTSTLLSTNKGWGGQGEIVSAAASVGAFPWGNVSSNDSAILVTLPPGGYTAQVSGASGDTGVALVEVYEVP
jgi:hypothetical protein